MDEASPESTLVTQENLDIAIEKGSLKDASYMGLPYQRFRDDSHGIPRGTVLLGGRAVPSYPPIGRIFVLERGLERVFGHGELYAEEKIDGYNIRVMRHGGQLLAFTRGGFICPFTTDRIADLADLHPLFEALPDAVLCGEVAGRDNPYIDACPPQAGEDVSLFAFDLMRLDRPGFVPLAERDAILGRFGVPRAQVVGRFTVSDVDEIRRAILRLHEIRAEGLIFKPPAEGVRVKYVTPSINVVDMVEDAPLLAELPGEFFVNRMLRLGMSLEELGLHKDVDRLEVELGRSLISRFMEVLREVREGGIVTKTFTVRVHSDAAADRVLAHMQTASTKIQVKELGRDRIDGLVRLRFSKIFQHSTSKLKGLLDGQIILD